MPPTTKSKNITATKALAEFQAEREQKKADKLSSATLFRVYLVPLLVVGVFAVIIFALIIPGIGEIFSQLDKTTQTNNQVRALDTRIQRLQLLAAQSAQVNLDLAALNLVVPEAITEVVNFQQQVRRLMAEQNGLEVGGATTAEQAIAAIERESITDSDPIVILQIPTTFTGRGTIQNIRSFIEDIKELNSFVVIGEMDVNNSELFDSTNLQQIDTSDQWQINITLIKYQFASNAEAQVVRALYLNRAESATLDQSVLEYIRGKAL